MLFCLERRLSNGKMKIQHVKGNMRDVATLNQLLVLANLESYNAVLINQGKNQKRENGIASAIGGTAVADVGKGKLK